MNPAPDQSKKWHRGSRFWMVAREAVWIAGFLAGAAIAFRADHVPEAFGMFGGIAGVVFAGSAYVNGRERDPEFQRAMESRERSEEQRDDDEGGDP